MGPKHQKEEEVVLKMAVGRAEAQPTRTLNRQARPEHEKSGKRDVYEVVPGLGRIFFWKKHDKPQHDSTQHAKCSKIRHDSQ